MTTPNLPDNLKEDGLYFLWYVAIKKGDATYREPVFKRDTQHEHGKRNNTSPNLWLLTDTRAQMRESIKKDPLNKKGRYRRDISELDKEEEGGDRYKWVPYGEKYTQPVNAWSYIFESYNVLDHYTKYNSDDWSVKAKTSCQMFCNGINVWDFIWNGKDIDGAISEARVLSRKLEGHFGFNCNDVDKIIGRKVWYHDQEGVIVRHFFPEDRIVIRSEKPDKTGFNLKESRKNRDKANVSGWPEDEWNESKEVHTGLFDSNIYWFRD